MSQVTAQQAAKSTSQTFLSAFLLNTALLGIELVAFIFLRQHFKRVYSPRTYLPPPDKRAKELPKGLFRWFFALITNPSESIIHTNGLDAYMFIRFLRMLIWMFAVYTITTWAILLPVDSAGISSSKANGLSQFNWTNIPTNMSERYAAHIIVVYILTFFTLWLIRRESLNFVNLRQQFLISRSHSRTAQARTVLITSVPHELSNDEKALRKWASFVPGGVGRIWIYRDTKALNKDYNQRLKLSGKIEGAVSKLLRMATKAWNKRVKLAEKDAKKQQKISKAEPAADLENQSNSDAPLLSKPPPTMEALLDLVPREKWPRHRLGSVPFMGKKVDTIDFCKQEIASLNTEIPSLRDKFANEPGKPLGSVFIECNLQIGAHVLAQCVSYHEPLMMIDKWVEVHNKAVIWKNLDDGSLETRSRLVISWGLTIGLIVLWSFPVAFVGSLSNLQSLCKANWLQWICKAHAPAPGIISGVLPPVFLAILFILLPIILRILAVYECIPLTSLVDLSVYKRYYVFLVIHGFLIVTLGSGLTAAIPQIVQDPTHAVTTLASQLPGSSIFFLTYMVTQAFAGAGMALLQIFPLIMHLVKKKFMGETPRQAFNVTFTMPSANFSLVLPRMSLLATIGIAYSVLSPVINGLAVVGYALYFLAWKFLLTYVFDQPDEIETGGMYFPMAISNLFTGLYIEQVCLAVLFFLGAGGHVALIAEGALMILLLLITLSIHILVNNAVRPVTKYLPMSLATKKLQERYELHDKKHLTSAKKNQDEENENDENDIFSRNRVQSVLRHRVKKLQKLAKTVETTIAKTVETTIETKILREEKPAAGASNGTATSTAIQAPNPSEPVESAPMLSLEHQVSEDSYSTHDLRNLEGETTAEEEERKKGFVIAPAAPRLEDANEGNEEDYEEEIEDHAFDHPSTYGEARWVWVPQDSLGFSKILILKLMSAEGDKGGVEASDIGAKMDEKGVVEVSRNPPDEDWSGGFDM